MPLWIGLPIKNLQDGTESSESRLDYSWISKPAQNSSQYFSLAITTSIKLLSRFSIIWTKY